MKNYESTEAYHCSHSGKVGCVLLHRDWEFTSLEADMSLRQSASTNHLAWVLLSNQGSATMGCPCISCLGYRSIHPWSGEVLAWIYYKEVTVNSPVEVWAYI